jgi:hypothetical protein
MAKPTGKRTRVRKGIGSADLAQVGCRLKEKLRARLESASRERNVSLNREMADRLERSFELEAMRSIEAVAVDLLSRYRKLIPAE